MAEKVYVTPDTSRRVEVYFIHAPGVGVKIGTSNNPEKRRQQLQTGMPVDLTLIGSVVGDYDLERTLHRRFRSVRVRGEWFDEKIVPLCELICRKPSILAA